ncbi:AP2/ERF family transcription factor [Paracidovorax citrulli]|uniref:AP2/ERF family transcription factor n=1 Tax=Paracidovorax citrulli TaxID=80869 RepID=A0ABY9ASJ9_PARCI|nr:AP2/ERF family transcription factor [Paracidovorax citrulli]UMT82014.1 AP2 domain-containing protein [Paracidovorax citrulli]WIY30239.1 AP2/ERF family transcription factor [Paracidovorax citrulli]WIY43312.1 AP2/ERF family transcription factor [Paracidovorax citrulli]WIY49798.1 AP2/ERF family transcription factor [Paracidovorax citrulli]
MAARAVREDEGESAVPGHSTGSALAPDAPAHAQALLQGNYGIICSQDKRKGTTSWLVRLRRDGRRVGTRYFYHHHYDSPEAALAAARAYRNALLEMYPPLDSREHRRRLSQLNTSGVAGVSRDRGRTGYWIASTKLPDGVVLLKRFSVKKHGENAAKELAIRERERQLQHVDNVKVRNVEAVRFFQERGSVDHSLGAQGACVQVNGKT